jgi:hypothetical protein
VPEDWRSTPVKVDPSAEDSESQHDQSATCYGHVWLET